jgi:two-component system, chemotaxis family, protein-glutamate methylesterase/glutaminase
MTPADTRLRNAPAAVPATGHDIVVIGASAGGVQALREVMDGLPPNLPAAVFVVLHVAPHGHSALPAILSRLACLPASHPVDGEEIQPGRIYVAPPDRHLEIEGSHIQLSRRASENGHRPAVDVLFRTAARSFGPRVVGVVLTGNLDDGTAGLAMIKRFGGKAVVQDPKEADYPSMPGSAIANVAVDHVLPLGDIAAMIRRLVYEPPAAEDYRSEEPDAMSERTEEDGSLTGIPSALTCPACGGSLFEKPGEQILHFRCRTGHAYSPESLAANQTETLDATLWAALRSLEETAALARRMEKRAREHDNLPACQRYQQRAREAEKHAALLRSMLQQGALEMDEVKNG